MQGKDRDNFWDGGEKMIVIFQNVFNFGNHDCLIVQRYNCVNLIDTIIIEF